MSQDQFSAEGIARALSGTRSGNGWSARCPAHDDRNPSFSISEGENGKVLVKCFAGCSQDDVIDALRSRGLWPEKRRWREDQKLASRPSKLKRPQGRDWKGLWERCEAAEGTLVETYLASRGLNLPKTDDIRFAAELPTKNGALLPAMVALVRDGIGEPIGVHRTFLDPETGRKAQIHPNRMMFGKTKHGSLRLGNATDVVMIGEGIETCLSAQQASGLPVWAALSASNLKNVTPPDDVGRVILLVDHDPAGMKAANTAAEQLALKRIDVRLAIPPEGQDFNDVLLEEAANDI